jgi:hypothetical protein
MMVGLLQGSPAQGENSRPQRLLYLRKARRAA